MLKSEPQQKTEVILINQFSVLLLVLLCVE